MFGSARNGANAYAKVGIETGVAAASPHKLIVMLFDGALLSIATATQKMKDGDIAGKGQAISKAITIIDSGLRASLNKEAGGEIADQSGFSLRIHGTPPAGRQSRKPAGDPG